MPTPNEETAVQTANKRRSTAGMTVIGAAAILVVGSIAWLVWTMWALQKSLEAATTFSLGLGLLLLAKALVTAVLIGTAYAMMRVGETMLLPIHSFLHYFELASKRYKEPKQVDPGMKTLLSKLGRTLDLLKSLVSKSKD